MKQTVGEFLATLRKEKGLTQEEVAFKLNVSNKTLSSWEKDRTAPDALTLLAIADLYEVTVDEILRGERINKFDDTSFDLSEKSRIVLKKKYYGKFSLKHYIFSAFGLLSIVLTILGFSFLVYTSIDQWVGITFSVIGSLSLLALTILLIYFEKSTLFYQGIVDNESENQKDNSFVLAIKHKNSLSLMIFSILFFAFGIATLVYFLLKGGTYEITLAGVSVSIDRSPIFIAFIVVSLVIGFAYFITGLIYGNMAVKHFGNETQKDNRKHNAKLASLTFGIGGGTLLILVIVLLILALNPITYYYESYIVENEFSKLHTKNLEEFADGLQVMELYEDITDYEGNVIKEKGKYDLSLPEFEMFTENVSYDLGNGFQGELYHFGDNGFYYCYIDISYFDKNSGRNYTLNSYPVATVIDGDSIKYLISCQIPIFSDDVEYTVFNMYITRENSLYNYETKEYGLCLCETYYFEYFSLQLSAILAAIALVVTSIIYFVKKKKQTFCI